MMEKHKRLFQLIGLTIALVTLIYGLHFFIKSDGRYAVDSSENATLQLSSPAFRERAEIPKQYTCKGENINPPLNITGVPAKAASLALIMHDPDALNSDFVHWLLWDIPTSTTSISASSVPVGAVQGTNGAAKSGYTGPCPPAGTGTHRYMFELYALKKTLGLKPGSDRQELEKALRDQVVEKFTLTGLFSAD